MAQGRPHPVWPNKPMAKNIRGERPWMVGTDSAKATIVGRRRNSQAGRPGYSHFSANRQQPYFEQLLGEVLTTTYSKDQPAREWRSKKGIRQETLDARVYAFGYYGRSFRSGWFGGRPGPVRDSGRTSSRTTAKPRHESPRVGGWRVEARCRTVRTVSRAPQDCVRKQRCPGTRSPLSMTTSARFRRFPDTALCENAFGW